MDAAPLPTVDDGEERSLDPRVIAMWRTVGWLSTVAAAVALLIPLTIAWLSADDKARVVRLVFLFLWLSMLVFNIWRAHYLPVLHYRHTRYRLDQRGIEIQRGVFFREVVNVPRSRVQHTDVSQGPIERHYGLGTLVIYTAGTDHARVTLPGLEHGLALRIRNQLLPSEAGDAV